MRHRKNKKTLDRPKAARTALIRNLATSVILYERIKTTEAKGRAVRPVVEHLITLGKVPTLHHRRLIGAVLTTDGAIKKTLEVLSPRYAERKGGMVRLTKLGSRQGDRAHMVSLELV